MAESIENGKDKWVLQHYIPVAKCRKCDRNFWNNRDSSSSPEETLTKLKEHFFNEHNITEHNITKHDSVHNVEYDENNEIPVRGFIRKHFSKLKEGVARCNLCFNEIKYTYSYYKLQSHLNREHNDKLTEIEKNEKKIRWIWDYFTEDNKLAICNSCNASFDTREYIRMSDHLRFYKKPGSSSSSDTNNTNSNTDMDTHAKETKRQKNMHSPPMVITREADNESVLQHYIPILICQKCNYSHLWNNKASLSSSRETLTKLEKHLLHGHNIKYDSVRNIQDDIYIEKIHVRRYLRKHFSKLKEGVEKCNICFEVINYHLKAYMLHDHILYKHEDKLTEIQKKEKNRVLWYWDYFAIKDEKHGICNICKNTIPVSIMQKHLKTAHQKTGPSSSSDTDDTDSETDMGQLTKEAKCQENTNSP